MGSFSQDLRFAFRMLGKNPVVTSAALLSLALGIGATTAIFTIINAFFLRGLAVEEPERVMAVFITEAKQGAGRLGNVSRPNYEDLRDRTNEIFTGLADVIFAGASLDTDGSDPEQIGGQLVTGNYFTVLGVEAAIGRTFDSTEDQTRGGHPIVVLSHQLWSRRFAADPGLIGTTIKLNRQPFTVIGVMPASFSGTAVLGSPSFWVPSLMYETFLVGEIREWFEDRRSGLTRAYGRLQPGVSATQAEAAVRAVGTALEEAYPVDNKGRNFTLVPLSIASINPNGRDTFVRVGTFLMVVVGLVLLIACANVANLLLGRAVARRREIGVRLALGAPRRRLLRQLLTESLLLAGVAGVLGMVIAHWGRSVLWSLRPPFMTQSALTLSFDGRVLLFAFAVTVATGIIFGLAPALQLSRPGIVHELAQPSDSSRGAARVFSFKNLLVMGQVGLSFVALIGAGLFLRSLGEAARIDLGFAPERLLTLRLNLGQNGYDEARGAQFFDRVMERVRAVPGVEGAALATVVPLTAGDILRTVLVEGRDPDAENNGILVPVGTVEAGYFKTLGIPLPRGRGFTEQDRDGAPAAVVINEAMAERFWPGENPIGQRFHFFDQEVVREVVGVSHNTKLFAVGEDPRPVAYMPRRQNYKPAMTLAVRTSGDPEALIGTVRGALQELDRALPLTDVLTVSDNVHQSLWAPRTGARLFGALGVLALLLAAIGIYGVMSYSVSQRDREIGIRVALGAERGDVLRLVIVQGMKVVALGLALGLGVALLMSRSLASLLYGIAPTDGATFGLALLAFAAVAFVANLLPARRATAVNPVRVLRFER